MILDPIDNAVAELAKMLGKPNDQLRVLLVFFLAYPIALGFRLMHGKWARHAYSIIVGALLHVFVFRWGVLHFWALDLAVYLLLTFMNRKQQPWVVFTVCMVHLSAMHIHRVIYDYGGWSMDATTFLMPLISRLSSLGFCYADGASEETKNLTKDQEQRKLIDKPTLLEIISYTSYPASNIVGPFFEFSDYKIFIEEQGVYKSIPISYGKAISKLLEGLVYLGLCIILPPYFDVNDIQKQEFYSLPLYIQYFKFMVACFVVRTTYYVAWCINEGSIALSGLTYNGTDKDGKPRFDKFKCCDAISLETCTTPREGLLHWNSQTAEWLRHYVYYRIKPAEGKDQTVATILTNLTSAFWHGFYPAYYNTFFFLAIVSEIAKDVYRLRDYFGWIPWPISPILRNVLIMTSLNYLAAGMILLELTTSIEIYKRYYFFGHVLLIGSFVALRFVLTPMLKSKKHKTKKE